MREPVNISPAVLEQLSMCGCIAVGLLFVVLVLELIERWVIASDQADRQRIREVLELERLERLSTPMFHTDGSRRWVDRGPSIGVQSAAPKEQLTMFDNVQGPSVATIGEGKHAVRILLQCSPGSPPSGVQQVGPFQVNGDQFVFDAHALGPMQLGAIKAIQYNVQFINGEGATPGSDGDFIIYIPSTGAIISIAAGVQGATDSRQITFQQLKGA